VPPRRQKKGAAPRKAGLPDQTKPANGPSDKTLEELKAEFVADLAGLPNESRHASQEPADERSEEANEAYEEKLEKRFEAREARLRKQVDKLKAQLAETESRLEEAKGQLSDLTEPGNGETPAARPAARKPRSGSRPKGGARSKARRPERSTNGRLDLNAATFEDLRSLGLSVTQSARVIAYRDTRGGMARSTSSMRCPASRRPPGRNSGPG
jgi:hypothetical protein